MTIEESSSLPSKAKQHNTAEVTVHMMPFPMLVLRLPALTRHWPGLIARIRCYPLQIAEGEECYLRRAAALLDRSASHEEGLVRREIAPRLRRGGGHDVPAEEGSRHQRRADCGRATEAESATDRPSGRTIGEMFSSPPHSARGASKRRKSHT